ncbi:hypothetical protein SAMN04488567_3456 [Limimaricola pyoseonensis]|uniref:Uncharacterized protein n=1 Tax=Limimaricola pyoseonensis TaxID=521013 RepID=A0A1G7IGT5_9RHOB|nr:hypothetical protein SAMN04488567_3456 [Limimaricola pyoseonensis]
MRPPISDGVMALAHIVGAVCRDRVDVLVAGDLVQQFRKHGGITGPAVRDLDSPNLQRVFVDPEEDLAPQASLWPAVLSCVPFAFPSALIPFGIVLGPMADNASLSIRKCSGPGEPRQGISTANVFWRRHEVLRSGTNQSRPIICKRLSTKPLSGGAPGRTAISSSGRPEWRRRYSSDGDPSCHSGAASRPCRDRTRSSGSHASSAPRYNQTSSWSCSSAAWVCGSCVPATMLDFGDESRQSVSATESSVSKVGQTLPQTGGRNRVSGHHS